MKIYDCFTFFNEIELLDIRLNILDAYVDYFVLVEASWTHANNDKPFIFEENKHKFEKFLPKIKHIKLTEKPGDTRSWTLENWQRQNIMQGLKDCQDDDIVIISDLDEIPNPVELKNNIHKLNDYYILYFTQKMYYYYLNCQSVAPSGDLQDTSHLADLHTTRAIKFGDLKNTHPHAVRCSWDGWEVKNGGHHFSFVGNIDHIINKIKNFGHQEYNNLNYTDPEVLKEKIKNNFDLFSRHYQFKTVPIDNNLPLYIVNNQEKFHDIIKH